MSAQCWCYQCAGRIVTRKTFNNHGRKNKPDEPERKIDGLGISLPELVVQHADANALLEEVDDSTQSEDTSGWPTDDSTDSEDAGRPSGAGRSNLSSQEVLLLFLDWMASHKATDSAASVPDGVAATSIAAASALSVIRSVLTCSPQTPLKRLAPFFATSIALLARFP